MQVYISLHFQQKRLIMEYRQLNLVVVFVLTIVLAIGCQEGPPLTEDTQIVDVLDRIATREEWSPLGELKGEKVVWEHDVSVDKAAGLQLQSELRENSRVEIADMASKGPRDPVHFIIISEGQRYHVSVAYGTVTLELTDKKKAIKF
jgi:hypothetical protein